MRLLKLGVYNDNYLRKFYAGRADLSSQQYIMQHKALINDCFGSSDFWTSELEKLGYETIDIIANAESLQNQWARERHFNFDDGKWLFEIATEQVKEFCPDVILVADYSTFTADFLKNIRRECPTLRLIMGWCGAPYQDLSVIREWDTALSCVPEMVSEFRSQGLESHHVDHAFAPRILRSIDRSARKIDFGFIGTVLPHDHFHLKREALLLHLVKNTGIEIWSDSAVSMTISRASIRRKFRELFNPVPRIDKRIARRAHPALFGLEMFQKLSEMRIVFNNHIDISPHSASNMRLFETTGVGACLLTDRKKNTADLFEEDTEIVTYGSAEECVEKMQYLLEHEDVRRQIAHAGQQRTLTEHTFGKRAARIDEIIRGLMGQV